MGRKFIFFINPISGTKGKEALLQLIEQKMLQQAMPYEILPTNKEGNYYFLKNKIANESITDIIICGGDGTVSQVASTLIDEPVNVGIIPMGSGNGLANTARIPKQFPQALELIFTGVPTYIDSFFINETFSCMLCGLGFDAAVAHNFARQKKRGLWTYVKESVAHFITAKPYPFEICNKGTTFSAEAYFISIANSNQFGNDFTIAPQASLSDGLLDIVVVKKMSKMKMVVALLKQITAGEIMDHDEKKFHQKDVLYFQTNRISIHNPNAAPLHVDGDPAASSSKFLIQVIPRAFKLIQPG